MKYRYEVRVIGTGEFAELLLATFHADEAKDYARNHGHEYHYGLAVIDTDNKTADLGDRVVPISEAFSK